MRPLLAVLLSTAIFAVVGGYLQLRSQIPQPRVADLSRQAQGTFGLELQATFAIAPDFFAGEHSLVIRRGQRQLYASGETFAAGTPIRVDDLADLVVGSNELYLEAFAAEADQTLPRAVRVRITRDGLPLTETTLWAEPGFPIAAPVTLEIPPPS